MTIINLIITIINLTVNNIGRLIWTDCTPAYSLYYKKCA